MNQVQQIPVLESVLKHVAWADVVDGCRFVCKSWRLATMREISRRIGTVMRNVPLYTRRLRLDCTRPRMCLRCLHPFSATDVIWRCCLAILERYEVGFCTKCRDECSDHLSIAFDEAGMCTLGGFLTHDSNSIWSIPHYGKRAVKYGHKGYPLHAGSDPCDMNLYVRILFEMRTIAGYPMEIRGKYNPTMYTFEWVATPESPTACLIKVQRGQLATMIDIARGYLGQITDWLPVRMQDGKSGLLCINREHHLYGKCMTE